MGGMGDQWTLGNGAMWGGVRTLAPFHQSMEIGDPEKAALAVGEAVCAADAYNADGASLMLCWKIKICRKQVGLLAH